MSKISVSLGKKTATSVFIWLLKQLTKRPVLFVERLKFAFKGQFFEDCVVDVVTPVKIY